MPCILVNFIAPLGYAATRGMGSVFKAYWSFVSFRACEESLPAWPSGGRLFAPIRLTCQSISRHSRRHSRRAPLGSDNDGVGSRTLAEASPATDRALANWAANADALRSSQSRLIETLSA